MEGMTVELVGNGIRCQGADYEITGITGGDHYSSGGPTVFDMFDASDYSFLEISRGGVYGNRIVSETTAEGIFKLRGGMVSSNNQETRDSDATLHIKPDEPFVSSEFAGREHIRLTLKAADYSAYTEES